MNRYFYLLRPPSIGCQPEGFTDRQGGLPKKDWEMSSGQSLHAFGYVEYFKPLKFEQIWRYDLLPDNDVERARLYFWEKAGRDARRAKEIESEYIAQGEAWLEENKRLDPACIMALILLRG